LRHLGLVDDAGGLKAEPDWDDSPAVLFRRRDPRFRRIFAPDGALVW
jgi:hypothetical protein